MAKNKLKVGSAGRLAKVRPNATKPRKKQNMTPNMTRKNEKKRLYITSDRDKAKL